MGEAEHTASKLMTSPILWVLVTPQATTPGPSIQPHVSQAQGQPQWGISDSPEIPHPLSILAQNARAPGPQACTGLGIWGWVILPADGVQKTQPQELISPSDRP